jgi:[ribosomal protein S18]-alanine N-acetyltransferase
MTAEFVHLRKADQREIEVLADIGYVTWEKDLLPFVKDTEEVRRAERRRLRQAVVDSLDRIIVAEAEDLPVGWCARNRGRPYVSFLFVTPLLQNNGIGSLLLKRMESLLELEGHDRVLLDTFADNVRAVHFYQQHGYQILALKTDGRGRDPMTGVRLEKRLTPYRGPISDVE